MGDLPATPAEGAQLDRRPGQEVSFSLLRWCEGAKQRNQDFTLSRDYGKKNNRCLNPLLCNSRLSTVYVHI